VLRSTDAESRQRIVMVHSAPITPTANSSDHQRDLSMGALMRR